MPFPVLVKTLIDKKVGNIDELLGIIDKDPTGIFWG
ncbi:MAG: DUF3024 domain-containing protein [Nitrospiraceae bacterium]|nr:MAG: DUF3024 domain-containing protein [Nitrospiraceae bacterium]